MLSELERQSGLFTQLFCSGMSRDSVIRDAISSIVQPIWRRPDIAAMYVTLCLLQLGVICITQVPLLSARR